MVSNVAGSAKPCRALCSAKSVIVGIVESRFCRTPIRKARRSAASSRLTVPGASTRATTPFPADRPDQNPSSSALPPPRLLEKVADRLLHQFRRARALLDGPDAECLPGRLVKL